MEKIFVVGMACLLALSLVGCYEYRGPYTKADEEEYLTGKYPDESINVRQKGIQTWECWFDELPDTVFQVWVGQGGGNPVPMLYSRLVSDKTLLYLSEPAEGGSPMEHGLYSLEVRRQRRGLSERDGTVRGGDKKR